MFPYAYKLNLAGWFHLMYFGVILPIFCFHGRRKFLGVESPLPNRLRYFRSAVLELTMLASLSIVVARVQWISLFPRSLPSATAVAAGVAMYAAAVEFMRPRWRRAVEQRVRVVHLFMPSTTAERAWWVMVSLLAGTGEEITWRGVQSALVGALTGSFWLAAIVCSISFGLTHIIQGWKSAAIIMVFALGFHTLVWLAGSLYVAMAVHVAFDLTAGINYGRLGRELGYDLAMNVPRGSTGATVKLPGRNLTPDGVEPWGEPNAAAGQPPP
jgi:membrane protease YdiL (CAAX protease family)